MNKLATEKRAQILGMLVEGMSMRAITRLTGVSINTVSKLLMDAGEAAAAFHDEYVREVESARVQCDEIWSLVYAKAKNVATAKAAPEGAGDAWTWTALDADSKMILSWVIGDRNTGTALDLMDDVRDRLKNRVEKHAARIALYFLHSNFCRIHKTLRCTPAIEAGLDTTVRSLEWIVGLVDERAPKPKRPRTYRKRGQVSR